MHDVGASWMRISWMIPVVLARAFTSGFDAQTVCWQSCLCLFRKFAESVLRHSIYRSHRAKPRAQKECSLKRRGIVRRLFFSFSSQAGPISCVFSRLGEIERERRRLWPHFPCVAWKHGCAPVIFAREFFFFYLIDLHGVSGWRLGCQSTD